MEWHNGRTSKLHRHLSLARLLGKFLLSRFLLGQGWRQGHNQECDEQQGPRRPSVSAEISLAGQQQMGDGRRSEEVGGHS